MERQKETWNQTQGYGLHCPSHSSYIEILTPSTPECDLARKENQILPFSETWMDLEGIMLRELTER